MGDCLAHSAAHCSNCVVTHSSIVVLEPDASWSSEVESEAGLDSRVVVLGRRPGESAQAFARRAKKSLHAIAPERPTRGVLVHGCGTGAGAATRNTLRQALEELVRSAGASEIVELESATG